MVSMVFAVAAGLLNSMEPPPLAAGPLLILQPNNQAFFHIAQHSRLDPRHPDTMPAPNFGPVLEPLWSSSERYPKKEPQARFRLQQLHQLIRGTTADSSWGHAHGSWGYTVLRAVYTPGSDALFAAAVERLRRYVRFWCHQGRFRSYGERAEQLQIAFAEPNDEIVRRFHLDVVEDRERLAGLDGNPDGLLAEYFGRWVAGRGLGPRGGLGPPLLHLPRRRRREPGVAGGHPRRAAAAAVREGH